jgi:hypothetical protein
MRGTATLVEGAVESPASVISLTPGGKSTAVMFIFSARSAETIFTTNCPVASILATVSFSAPGARGPQPKPTTTGLSEKALKKD